MIWDSHRASKLATTRRTVEEVTVTVSVPWESDIVEGIDVDALRVLIVDDHPVFVAGLG